MEEISEAALAYYENGSEEQKQWAQDFFNSLDEDGNGTVDVHEFINILSEGDGSVGCSRLFQELDRDGNGNMDFNEFLTLFYIIKSQSRPFCDGCSILLKGLFFTCVKCHESSNDTFDLCSACYRGKRFSHQHAAFLDNYALLAHKRLITLEGKGQPNTSQATSLGTSSSSPEPPKSSSGTSSSSPEPPKSSLGTSSSSPEPSKSSSGTSSSSREPPPKSSSRTSSYGPEPLKSSSGTSSSSPEPSKSSSGTNSSNPEPPKSKSATSSGTKSSNPKPQMPKSTTSASSRLTRPARRRTQQKKVNDAYVAIDTGIEVGNAASTFCGMM